jgi:hypothetical protein
MRTSGYIPFPVRRPQGEGAPGMKKGVVAVNAATGTTFHLSRPRIDGPAERTVIEPWLTELPHLNLNAYADSAFADSAFATAPPAPALAVVETLPAARPAAGRRAAALAEAA